MRGYGLLSQLARREADQLSLACRDVFSIILRQLVICFNLVHGSRGVHGLMTFI